MLNTVILKPTRNCNAKCVYCSSPPITSSQWSIDNLRTTFNNLRSNLSNKVTIIWHGGEPLLMGREFFHSAKELLDTEFDRYRYSLQTNLLAFDESWVSTIHTIFRSILSTSYEPGGLYRLYNGTAKEYSNQFENRIRLLDETKLRCAVTGVYFDETLDLIPKLYDFAASHRSVIAIRVNHGMALGRASIHTDSTLIPPNPIKLSQEYIKLFHRWIVDQPDFSVQPFKDMIQMLTAADSRRCPWTSECFNKIIGIEPDFSIYNCSDQASYDSKLRFGNILEKPLDQIYQTPEVVKILHKCKKITPSTCFDCEYFDLCGGGCRVFAFSEMFNSHCVWKDLFRTLHRHLEAGKLDWYLNSELNR